MTTENHHERHKADDNNGVTPAVLPVNSIPGDITEIEYESALESTRAERAWQAREEVWDSDPDWQAFRRLCYSDTGTPDAEAIRKGVQHLIAAARRGHAPAQCRLATELHLGEGRLGIETDIRKAVTWYRAAAKNGDPIALQSLVVLKMTHPDIVKQVYDSVNQK